MLKLLTATDKKLQKIIKSWYYMLANCSIWSVAINIMDKLAVLLPTFVYCLIV